MSVTNTSNESVNRGSIKRLLPALVMVPALVYLMFFSSPISVSSAYGQQIVFPPISNPSTTIQPFPSIYPPFLPIYQQVISPWFPSLPAISCGVGIFSFNIEGVPDKGVHVPVHDQELMALQIKLDRNNPGSIFVNDDDVSGEIFIGKKNIMTNQGDDFDVQNLFNNCRTLAYSSSPDVKIKTPLPATPASEQVNTIILPQPAPLTTPTTTTGTLCPAGYLRNSLGICVPI